MSMRSDHKALLFIGGIAVLGATVRVARAVGAAPLGEQAALEHQMQAADSAKRSLVGKRATKTKRQSSRAPMAAVGPSPRDYRGRLDLDLATAMQIDSLPGVGPALAKRIVADRMQHGAYRELIALHRVKGMNLKLLARLDSLVSFSGAYKPPLASDTEIVAKGRRKS